MISIDWSRLCFLAAASILGACGSDDVPVPAPVERFAGPDPSLTAVDLGWHAIGTHVEIDVPDDALGVTVSARGEGPIGIWSLDRPDGSPVVADFALDGVVRFEGTPGPSNPTAIAVGLPQSDASMPLLGGAWTLVLGQYGGGRHTGAHLTSWIRRAGAAPRGRIDVNLFVADGTATEAYLHDVLALAFDGFAGLRLGEVAVQIMDGGARTLDDDREAHVLLEATRGAALGPAVNVIAVGDMSGMLGSPTGKAGGVPGLGCDHGTELSGLLFEVSGDRALDAARIRHEAGHLAGLFHTSDDYGFDPLEDTAECADPEGDLCPDAGNVMFPRATGKPRTELTEAQTRVVLGSTLYRAD